MLIKEKELLFKEVVPFILYFNDFKKYCFMLPFGANNLQEFVEKWNKIIPIDRWYRQKYNIPFCSDIHKNIKLTDMFFEFYEYVNYKFKKKEEKEEQEPYIRGKGNFLKSNSYTEKDIDQLFDELDIDNLD